ncbi:hypothetical protein IVB38_09070 [Bradyrhizobium sp. 38]|uniref:hypothetical protein n=1 Tax=unclassified Bradyrhizobium TaxID=2631580 RepID=UPI001FFA7223|nr:MULTISPECIES: hypothetical protein [unclassified Bradyrhizobium]MCK1336179.1 hypothetical protein [Bradyrhizobium sp. 38]MCK1780086.1 hypothetical protein [Bradyrhizobium sp. 132]
MDTLWRFFLVKKNRDVLAWLGGGAVVAIAGLWTAFVQLQPKQAAHDVAPVSANCGSVAAGGSISGATIVMNGSKDSDCSSKQ